MTDADKHEEARRLTEKALDQLELGNEPEADKLIEKAKKLDPSGAAEVVADLNEDAATRGVDTPE